MNESELHLDGNSAAGLLSEAFGVEMTAALGICAHCGAQGALGAALAYAGGPGTVLRCSACREVLMRAAHIDGRLMLDLRGLRVVELAAGG